MAASGATGQLTALDVAANNVANVTTPAYKGEQTVFQQHLVDAARAGNAVEVMRYNGVREVGSNWSEGPMRVTDRGLDVAIRGEGFFAVQSSAGEQYTRSGSFQIASDGTLTTTDGAPLLNTARRLIKVPVGTQDVTVNESGTVSANGEPIGQLRTVKFAAQTGLARAGHFQFRATPQSGEARATPLILETGALEMSNVSVVKGMTDIVTTTRAFDALQKVIDSFRSADERANDLMRKR